MVARLLLALLLCACAAAPSNRNDRAALRDPAICRLEPSEWENIPTATMRQARPARVAEQLQDEIATAKPGSEQLAVAYIRLGNAERQVGRLDAARDAYENALALRSSIEPRNAQGIAIAELNLGGLMRELGHPAPSLRLLTSALERLEAHTPRNDRLIAAVLAQLAMAQLDAADAGGATRSGERAAEIQAGILGPHDPAHINTLRARGFAASIRREYGAAIRFHERAIAISRFNFAQSSFLIPNGFHGLSLALLALGEFDTARRCSEAALALRERTLGTPSQPVILSLLTLARIALATGDYAEARRRGEEARSAVERMAHDENSYLARSLLNLGQLYRALNDFDRARELLARAVAIQEREFGPDHEAVAMFLTSLASTLEGEEAISLQRRALAIRTARVGPGHPLRALGLAELAGTLARTGALEDARRHYEEALAIYARQPRQSDGTTMSILIGHAHVLERLGARADARAVLDRTLALAGARGFAASESWPLFHAYSRSLAAAGERTASIYFAKRAVNAIQALRATLVDFEESLQQSFLVDKTEVYRNLADALIQEGRLGEALEVLRLLKEEEFREFIQRDAMPGARDARVPLTPEEERIGAAVGAYSIEAIKAAGELDRLAERARRDQGLPADEAARRARLEVELLAARDGLRRFLADLPNRLRPGGRELRALNEGRLDALRQALRKRPRTAILHYVMGPDRLSIILTLPGVSVPFQHPTGDQALYREIVDLRRAVVARRDPHGPARALHEKLIAPIEQELAAANVDTLLVSLDGALRYVPFGALFDGKQYLVERYAIGLLTEAATAHGILGTLDAAPRIAGMGVTRGSAKLNLKPLPAVRDELFQIVSEGSRKGLLPGTTVLDDAFTVARLRELVDRNYPILHVASHFQFRPGSERESFLLLGNDDALSLEQLRRMDLPLGHVDLLALSACQTAVADGRTAQGTEIEGLGVLLQNQGARNVLATLWQVADTSTSQLMVEFYKQHASTTKLQALRRAQLSLIRGKSYAHPFHWGSFVLMGSGV